MSSARNLMLSTALLWPLAACTFHGGFEASASTGTPNNAAPVSDPEIAKVACSNPECEERKRRAQATCDDIDRDLRERQERAERDAQQQERAAEEQAERERAQAEAQAQRLERMEAQASQCMESLEQARAAAQDQLVRAASLEGRCAALDKQLAQVLQRVGAAPDTARTREDKP